MEGQEDEDVEEEKECEKTLDDLEEWRGKNVDTCTALPLKLQE